MDKFAHVKNLNKLCKAILPGLRIDRRTYCGDEGVKALATDDRMSVKVRYCRFVPRTIYQGTRVQGRLLELRADDVKDLER